MDDNLQTVIVSKQIASSREQATEIAGKFANRIYTSRETGESWRFRQRPPGDFKSGTFRTFHVPGNEGVTLVYGDLKKKSNPSNREVKNFMRLMDAADQTVEGSALASVAHRAAPLASDSITLTGHMAYVIARNARRLGYSCPTDDMACTERFLQTEGMVRNLRTMHNPTKKKAKSEPKISKNPKVMPDPGPCALLGDLLEFRWRSGKDMELWEPDRRWLFLWSPRIKGIVCIPRIPHMKAMKVNRSGGGAKMYERFTAKKADRTYEIQIPKIKLVKLGRATHIVYRSDKWTKNHDYSNYIHDFKDGVNLFCGPNLKNPSVFLCFGGKLTCTERGLVF